SLVSAVLIAWAILALLLAMGRGWVQARAMPVALALAPVTQVAVLLLLPITFMVRRVEQQVNTPETDLGIETALMSDDALRRMISAADDEEPIEERDKQMIAS